MSRLQILDLSYCEAISRKNLEVTGGRSLLEYFGSSWLNRPTEIFDNLDGYEKTEIYSDSETVVKKLENSKTGESGYQIVSKDGRSSSLTLTSSNPSSISTRAVSYSII
ncbi:hypothetical protein [Myxosarcina sp. GI1(2024)]